MKLRNATELFEYVLKEKKNPRIKLIGDSITHGVGGSGWEQSGRVIVERWSESPNGYCWANLFRDYMKKTYGAVVVNNGCTGTDVDFVMEKFSTLVDADDDIIVCTIGTNNRHKFFSDGEKPDREIFLDSLYDKLKNMYNMFKEAGIPTIFVVSTPASEKNEKDGIDYWRIIHMSDINNCYKKLAGECGAIVLSLYDLFLDYCNENNLKYDEFLCDGLHPNDKGYKVMFDLIVKAFGV